MLHRWTLWVPWRGGISWDYRMSARCKLTPYGINLRLLLKLFRTRRWALLNGQKDVLVLLLYLLQLNGTLQARNENWPVMLTVTLPNRIHTLSCIDYFVMSSSSLRKCLRKLCELFLAFHILVILLYNNITIQNHNLSLQHSPSPLVRY